VLDGIYYVTDIYELFKHSICKNIKTSSKVSVCVMNYIPKGVT